MTALALLALMMVPACLEEPNQAVDARVPGSPPAGQGGPHGDRGPGAPDQPGQPPPGHSGAEAPAPGSLPPLPDGAVPSGRRAPRAAGPLKVALVPSSRAVLLYKALVNHGDRKDGGPKTAKGDRGDAGVPGEGAGATPRRDATKDVVLLTPSGGTLAPLAVDKDAFRAAVGTFQEPLAQPSAGLAKVQAALLAGDVDCGVLPSATLIQMAASRDETGQALVLVAQLGSAGGDNSDLIAVRRAGTEGGSVPKAARTGATSGLDARLVLNGLVSGPHQDLGDESLAEGLTAGTVDLIVAPQDLLASSLERGAAVPFRALTAAEAAPSAQVLACQVSALGSKEAREALKALLRVYRVYLKRRGAEDPTATGASYPQDARVDVALLGSMLDTLRSQELVSNAALKIVDLQDMSEAGEEPEGPVGASAVLVDNRLVAVRSGGDGRGGRGAEESDLELPPPPE